MKLLTGCLVLAIVGVTAGPADAVSWPWNWNWKLDRGTSSRNPKLPTAIDYPVVRPKLKAEKATRQQHPSKYARQEWGQEWERTLNVKHVHEGNHSVFLD